ncbi:hypothetical protein [Streptomyces sp. NPDC005780]|uniref:hypothetical protein n=1 Tax=Streptomyces sp. NPDC005780 TaxID=3364730 RepID=UPI0036AAAB11
MNRERGLHGVNSYTRELGFDPLAHLPARSASPSWLDLCGGEGVPCGLPRPGCPHPPC